MYGKDGKILDQREMLRVKAKSLAEESKIIRKEEHRTTGILRNRLQEHRRGVVRAESRHTGLAYGFIRGLSWERIEPNYKHPPDWNQVRKMLKKYGPANMVEPDCMKK